MERVIMLEVVESDTILAKVVQVIKRRRIVIRMFIAETTSKNQANARIKILVEAELEQCRLMKKQLERLIDVVEATVL